MTYHLLYESCPWHTRVALFDEAYTLLSLRFDDPSRQFLEGTVVLGRVRKISTPLDAAFVDIGDEVDGFLPLKTLDDGKKLTEGEALLVRVARACREDKGALLDARTAANSPENVKPPHTVFPPPHALSRALMDAGEHPVQVWLTDDNLREEVKKFVQEDKISLTHPGDDEDLAALLEAQLNTLANPDWDLPSGGRLTMEHTKALTAFDVDVGAATGGRREDVAQRINLEAADEIVRLCRLLDIGGNIIVDFITLDKVDRKRVRQHILDAFANKDSHKVQVMDISRFGLLEINRQRHGEMLDKLTQKPVYCAGRILLDLWRKKTPPAKGYTLKVAPSVADILKQRLTNAASMAYLGCAVDIQENYGFQPWNYQIL